MSRQEFVNIHHCMLLVGSLDQNIFEELTARAQKHFVCSDLVAVITHQCYIDKLLSRHEAPEGVACTVFEILPCQVELLGFHDEIIKLLTSSILKCEQKYFYVNDYSNRYLNEIL